MGVLIMHSVFLIMVLTALLLWVYQRGKCCVLEKKTVCHYWGCAPFWGYWCGVCCTHNFGKKRRKKRMADRARPLMDEIVEEVDSISWQRDDSDQKSRMQVTGSKLTSTE